MLAHHNAIWPWQFDADLVLGTQIDFVVVLYNTLKSETPFIQEKKKGKKKRLLQIRDTVLAAK